ncbi:MAG: hypothetical protein ACI835_000918 [Planctomycetota bacterium]|jgi:hypothetical protein
MPALALSAAISLLSLAPKSEAFSLLGHSLDLDQRDFRVSNNFTDASANDNQNPYNQFPGQVAATMSVWKGCVEWNSKAHGNGNGAPHPPGCDAPANYCVASANTVSSGGSMMASTGSQSLSLNDFGLRATDLPNGQPGIFFYGGNQ